jgi:hypothetical protein
VWPAPDDARARAKEEREKVLRSAHGTTRGAWRRARRSKRTLVGAGVTTAAARACDTNTHAAQTGRGTQTPNRRKTAMAVCARGSKQQQKGVCGDTHTARTRGWQDERALMCARGPWRSAARARARSARLGQGVSGVCAAVRGRCTAVLFAGARAHRLERRRGSGHARPRAPRPLVQAGRGGRARACKGRGGSRVRVGVVVLLARACGARGSVSPFSLSLARAQRRWREKKEGLRLPRAHAAVGSVASSVDDRAQGYTHAHTHTSACVRVSQCSTHTTSRLAPCVRAAQAARARSRIRASASRGARVRCAAPFSQQQLLLVGRELCILPLERSVCGWVRRDGPRGGEGGGARPTPTPPQPPCPHATGIVPIAHCAIYTILRVCVCVVRVCVNSTHTNTHTHTHNNNNTHRDGRVRVRVGVCVFLHTRAGRPRFRPSISDGSLGQDTHARAICTRVVHRARARAPALKPPSHTGSV